MKALAGASVVTVLALTATACGAGRPTSAFSMSAHTKTHATRLHVSTRGPLPRRLRTLLHSMEAASAANGSIREIAVYGPGSRTALNEASGGGWVRESTRERKARFYLIVERGRFVCTSCPRPLGVAAPRGTIWTEVWSPAVQTGDSALMNRLPASVRRLHRLAQITLS